MCENREYLNKTKQQNLERTNILFDGDVNTCISPFANTNINSFTFVFVENEIWRTEAFIRIQVNNTNCDFANELSVHLELHSQNCQSHEHDCYPDNPASAQNNNYCYFYCHQIIAHVQFIVIKFSQRIIPVNLCDIAMMYYV